MNFKVGDKVKYKPEGLTAPYKRLEGVVGTVRSVGSENGFYPYRRRLHRSRLALRGNRAGACR